MVFIPFCVIRRTTSSSGSAARFCAVNTQYALHYTIAKSAPVAQLSINTILMLRYVSRVCVNGSVVSVSLCFAYFTLLSWILTSHIRHNATHSNFVQPTTGKRTSLGVCYAFVVFLFWEPITFQSHTTRTQNDTAFGNCSCYWLQLQIAMQNKHLPTHECASIAC